MKTLKSPFHSPSRAYVCICILAIGKVFMVFHNAVDGLLATEKDRTTSIGSASNLYILFNSSNDSSVVACTYTASINVSSNQ